MKLTFASQYSRKTSNLEYPLEVYCYGHFEVKACEYYSLDCPNSCSFAKAKDTLKGCADEGTSSSDTLKNHSFSSLHSNFTNGLERFLKKWGEKWKK